MNRIGPGDPRVVRFHQTPGFQVVATVDVGASGLPTGEDARTALEASRSVL